MLWTQDSQKQINEINMQVKHTDYSYAVKMQS